MTTVAGTLCRLILAAGFLLCCFQTLTAFSCYSCKGNREKTSKTCGTKVCDKRYNACSIVTSPVSDSEIYINHVCSLPQSLHPEDWCNTENLGGICICYTELCNAPEGKGGACQCLTGKKYWAKNVSSENPPEPKAP